MGWRQKIHTMLVMRERESESVRACVCECERKARRDVNFWEQKTLISNLEENEWKAVYSSVK